MNSNTLEFIVRMKDMMSSGLVKMAGTAQSSFGKVQEQTTNLIKKNDTLSQSYDAIKNKMQQLEESMSKSNSVSQIKAIKKELQELQQMADKAPGGPGKSAGKSFFGGLRGEMLEVWGIEGGIKGAWDLGKDILGESSQREQQKVNLETMTGDKKTGDNLLGNVVKMADKSPFESTALVDDTKQLLQYGLTAKQILPVLHQLGDVSGGNKEHMDGLTSAFGRMVSEGKLNGRVLMEMINNGFNPLNEMTKKTGKSSEELRKMMDKGKISVQDVENAMVSATGVGGRFHNLMKLQSETLAGRYSTVMDHVHEKMIAFGNSMAPAAKDILEFVDKIVEGVSNISTASGGWSDYFTTIRSIAMTIWGVIEKVAKTVWSMVSDIFTFVQNSQILKDLFSFIGFIIGKAADILSYFVDSIKWYWDNVLMPILNGIDKVYQWITGRHSVDINVNAPKKPAPTANDEAFGGAVTFAKQKGSGDDDETTKGITSGGPRIININGGVKFTDKIEIHAVSMKDGIEDLEKDLEEMFLRVLQSGAALQDARS